MKNLFIIMLVLALSGTLKSQNSFIKRYGYVGNFHQVKCHSIAPKTDGGYILAGEILDRNNNALDNYFIGTNAAGDTLWTKQIDFNPEGYGYNRANCIRPISNNRFIVGGWAALANSDGYLMKMNIDGDTLWTRLYGGEFHGGEIACVEETADGGFIMGKGGVYHLMKTDSLGVVEWGYPYYALGYVAIFSIEVLNDGYVFCGFVNDAYNPGLKEEFLVVKVNLDGAIQWYETFGDIWYDKAYDIIETTDLDIVSVGVTTNPEGPSGQNVEGLIVKLNSNGDVLWTKTFELYGYVFFNAIEEAADGGYVITGSAYYDGSGGFKEYILIIKVDSNGNELWRRFHDASELGLFYGYQQGNDIHIQDDGHIVVGGTCNGTGPYSGQAILLKTDGEGLITSVDELTNTNPIQIVTAFPNPFSESTTIEYKLQEMSHVKLDIYNSQGQKVRTLLDRKLNPGIHQIIWNGRGETNEQLPPGMYLCSISDGNHSKIIKVQLIK